VYQDENRKRKEEYIQPIRGGNNIYCYGFKIGEQKVDSSVIKILLRCIKKQMNYLSGKNT